MNAQITNLGGFNIPTHDEIVLAYYTTTNNVQTATYKKGANTVAVLTLTYAGGGAASDDRITNIKRTV